MKLRDCSLVDVSSPALVRTIMAVVCLLPFSRAVKCLVAIDDREMCDTSSGNKFRKMENDVVASL